MFLVVFCRCILGFVKYIVVYCMMVVFDLFWLNVYKIYFDKGLEVWCKNLN